MFEDTRAPPLFGRASQRKPRAPSGPRSRSRRAAPSAPPGDDDHVDALDPLSLKEPPIGQKHQQGERIPSPRVAKKSFSRLEEVFDAPRRYSTRSHTACLMRRYAKRWEPPRSRGARRPEAEVLLRISLPFSHSTASIVTAVSYSTQVLARSGPTFFKSHRYSSGARSIFCR